MKPPIIVAHRGLHDVHIENTLAALRAAWDAGITWVEIDVRGSREGEPFVLHDETLDRTTRGRGPIDQTPAAALRELDVPSLQQAVEAMPPDGRLLVEIKPSVAEQVVRRALDLCPVESCVVQSFDEAVLWVAFAHRPDVRLELLVDDAARQPIAAGPWRAVNADFKTLTPQVVRRLRDSADYAVGAWTVNADTDIRRIAALFVDRIISDRPLRVRDICKEIA